MMVATCLKTQSAESATFHREASALIVGEPEAAPFRLLLEDAAFHHQVLDHVLLVAVDPSREGHKQYRQRGKVGRQGSILPCLIPARVLDGAGPNTRHYGVMMEFRELPRFIMPSAPGPRTSAGGSWCSAR
jgi:hypothetical protein